MMYREIVANSINDIMIIIYIKLLFLDYFRKFLVYSKMGKFLTNSCFNFKNNMNLEIEYLLLILLIHLTMTGAYFFGKRKENLIWTVSKLNKMRIVKRIYHIVLSYNYVDVYFQFYFYLSTVSKPQFP